MQHPSEPLFYTIEADYNTLPPDLCQQLLNDPKYVNGDSNTHELPARDFGHPRANRRWASCINVIDPVSDAEPQVIHTVNMEDNEATTAVALVSFSGQENEEFLVVGTGKDMVVNPRSFSEGYIHVYRFQENGRELEFIHKTKVEEPPSAILAFQGRVLVGLGKTLRLYDLGMRQMLRKAQAEVVPQHIVSLNTQGSRIVVTDVQQSVTYVSYKPQSNKLIPFCDDAIARWSTCATMMDYDTVAGGDKFGNLWIVRCPTKVSEEADEDESGLHLLNARDYLHGTANRVDLMAHFYTQDIPTSITRTSLTVGGQEVIFWSGLMGTIGVLIPFVARDDARFFQLLEESLRKAEPPLAGRDHLMYRGYYQPCKGVIDGDLCERFNLLSNDQKMVVAAEVERSVREIERKLSVSYDPKLNKRHPLTKFNYRTCVHDLLSEVVKRNIRASIVRYDFKI